MISIYYSLTTEELKDLVERLKTLADFYAVDDRPDKCPLCQFDILMKKKYAPKEILGNCKFCPWITIRDIKCLEYWKTHEENELERIGRLYTWSSIISKIIAVKSDKKSCCEIGNCWPGDKNCSCKSKDSED